MTHLYIELNTGIIEEVNSSIISKLYELASSGDLDLTSDLKGRLHTASARDIHVNYLTTRFSELYITADTLYITFADPYIEEYMKKYIGDGTGTVLAHILSFISSGKKFGENYNSPYLGNNRTWALTYNLKILPITFNEFGTLFEGVTKINQGAFSEFRNLKSITLPSTVTEIGNLAFSNTYALTSLNLENILSIGSSAFKNSHIEGDISLPNLTYLGLSAFQETSILRITDLGNITEIPGGCFSNCTQLTSVQLPNTVTTIKSTAFLGCTNLTSINLSNITTTDGESLFENTKLTTVTFNANYLILSAKIFENCSNLTTVTGLSNVTTLGNLCFNNCTNLLTIDIDNSKITVLGAACFAKCSNLSNLVTVNFPNLLTLKMNGFIRGPFKRCSLILHVVNLGSITEIGDVFNEGAFDHCTNLQTVTLPETVQTLRYSGITNCPNVKWVKLLSTSVPFYNLVDGYGNSKPYGYFFGESFRDNNISNEYLGSTYPIYVRDELVNDYKSTEGFSCIAFRIKPLSLFATDFPNG